VTKFKITIVITLYNACYISYINVSIHKLKIDKNGGHRMDQNKENLRKLVYNKLIEHQVSTPHYIGRIPEYKGSKKAAANLCSTKEWKTSRTIFTSPDTAQRQVRENALKDGKILIMVTPKIEAGYLKLKSQDIKGLEKEASTIEGAVKYGEKIDQLPRVDLVVEGSVAVDKVGGRLGKGGGYGDREIEYLKRTGSINQKTPIVSTVHNLQIVENVPTEKHDQKINMIVTPDKILRLKLQQPDIQS
jgi:5-formyltetrahydrofolate cyclo-ligase